MSQQEVTQTTDRTAVYRLHDENEQLLYVGVAADPHTRFQQHQRDKPWWPRVATREIEWCGSRAEALVVEALAIVGEMPLHNEAGVQWPHHQLGEAPAQTVTTTAFKADPQGWMDRVAETGEPVVITRHKAPQVVIVPYFDTGARGNG